MIRTLDLFSGIGGFALGLERTGGFETVGFCEIEPYCRAVLKKHWPNVWQHDDIKTLTKEIIDANCGRIDCIVAGFPCQPVSDNGKKQAQDDERWMWPETCRIIGAIRPRGVLLENVTGLLKRGFGDVLRDLAGIGYDAEWDCIPAAAFGAPHLRERVFVVSYPTSTGLQGQESAGRVWRRGLLAECYRWSAEPGVRRVGDGVPEKVDRLKALGNSVVPQVVEWIGNRIIESGVART